MRCVAVLLLATTPAARSLSLTTPMSQRTSLTRRPALGISGGIDTGLFPGDPSHQNGALRLQSAIAGVAHDVKTLHDSSVKPHELIEATPRHSKAEVTEMERITALGGVVNLALCLVKVVAGVVSGSAAMVADAAHSLSDLLSDIVTWGAVKYGARSPTKAMPYGYGKYEPLGALVVAGMLTLGAATVFTHSARALWAVRAAATGAEAAAFGGWRGLVAMGAAVISIGSKEWIARATEKVGKRFRSLPLKVNAQHHRSDALSSIVALVGTGGAVLGLPWLDPLSGLVVGLFVGKMALEIGQESFGMLVDARDDECIIKITECLGTAKATAAFPPHLLGFSDIRARRMGNKWDVDMWIVLHEHTDMASSLHVTEKVREAARSITGVNEVCVQVRFDESAGSPRARGDSSPKSVYAAKGLFGM